MSYSDVGTDFGRTAVNIVNECLKAPGGAFCISAGAFALVVASVLVVAGACACLASGRDANENNSTGSADEPPTSVASVIGGMRV